MMSLPTKVKILALLLLMGALPAGAAAWPARTVRLGNVHFQGNQKISTPEVKRWFALKRDDLVTPQVVAKRAEVILQNYRDRGYYFAKIDSVNYGFNRDSSRVDVSIFLSEAQRLKTFALRLSGLTEAQKQTLEPQLRTRPGKTFSPEVLEEDIEQVISYFEQRGYPYCQVNVRNLAVDSETEPGLDIALEVQPGPKVVVGEIEIRGNEQTREGVILRELGVSPGEVYNQKKVDRIKTRLEKLSIFKWVNPAKLVLLEDGRGKVIVELAEGSYNRFDGVVGYNPGADGRGGFFTGFLDFSFGNLFGTGRQIDAHWERRTEKTQNLQLRYLEPWVAGLPLNVGFHFEQLIRDTSYVERQVGIDFNYIYNDHFSVFSGVSRRTISPDSVGALLFGIPPSDAVNLNLGLSFSTLNNPFNPRKGLRYQTAFSWSRKNIRKSGLQAEPQEKNSFAQKRISIDFETYFPLFNWQVLAIALHGREITSGEDIIPLTEQYRLGGTRTLRGYREDQFRGNRIGWGNFEYRYLLGPLSRFFLFVDVGYFSLDRLAEGRKIRSTDSKIGYGFGLRLETRLGLLGIDYGLGQGDGFSNGKIHIGLRNAF